MTDVHDCPQCGDPLSIHGVCGSCDYGHAKAKRKSASYDPEMAARNAELHTAALAHYLRTATRSSGLTEQQWYNVCKFWPSVAIHCNRIRPIVGADNPLDKTAVQGSLLLGRRLRAFTDVEANAERRAIQQEAAA